jgi:hypothetical protein
MYGLSQVVLGPLEAAGAREESRLAVGKFELIFD